MRKALWVATVIAAAGCSEDRRSSGPAIVNIRDAGRGVTVDGGVDGGVDPGRDGGSAVPGRDGGMRPPRRDGGTRPPPPPPGQCPPGALCLADTDGDTVGDRCIFFCQNSTNCPRSDLGCFTCNDFGGANYCAPNATPPNLEECRFPSDGNPPVLLCLDGDCPTGQVCLRLDPNAPMTSPGYCSPACTP